MWKEKNSPRLSDADFTDAELDRLYGTNHTPDTSNLTNQDCRTIFGMTKRQLEKLNS